MNSNLLVIVPCSKTKIWKDRPSLTKVQASQARAYANFMLLMTFFEGLGVLVMKGLVDVALVEDLLSERVIWYWEDVMRESREDARIFVNDPKQGDHIEYLYHEMKHRQRLTARSEVS